MKVFTKDSSKHEIIYKLFTMMHGKIDTGTLKS